MATLVDVALDPDVFSDEDALLRAAARKAGMNPAHARGVRVHRRSVDARRGRVLIRARVEVLTHDEPAAPVPRPVDLPALGGEPRVAVVGAGPAGLFCALELARSGIRSILLERGQAVSQRRRDVADLSARGILHPESNYCFGEGGAGTFSDGKLYTRAHKRGPVRGVLETLVAHGESWRRSWLTGRPRISWWTPGPTLAPTASPEW